MLYCVDRENVSRYFIFLKYYYDKNIEHLLSLGTTLLLAILDCSSSVLWVANVGDSRGVLSNSSSAPKGEVMPLSFDHKPSQVSLFKH